MSDKPEDRLWVRETWRVAASQERYSGVEEVVYKADGVRRALTESEHFDSLECMERAWDQWIPNIHCYRWASRILLEIASVRVERLRDISEEDAKAEGVNQYTRVSPGIMKGFYQGRFSWLWESINGPGSWEANPWVWVIEFKRLESLKKRGGEMRAYKFRSWHKGSGDMIVDAYPGQCFQWLRERQPIEIMQFTGLHDKSGREIYEGDRVKISCHIECESANCRVGWFNDRWWVFTDRNQQGVMEECKLPLGELAQSIDKEGKYSRVEVIGNIHENPDLVTP